MLSRKQLEDVCMMGCGDYRQCRYIREEGNGTFNCCKLRPNEKKKIDQKIDEFFRKCNTNGTDPYGPDADPNGPAPLGDNCQGHIILHNVTTGLPDN